ncbi:MAG: hypothetical protein ACOC38_06315 [Promethearchaeia archaeon]
MVGRLEAPLGMQFSLIWGNMRNLIDFTTIRVPSRIRLIGSIPGQFPVDAYYPIFLEEPRDGKRSNLFGRHNHSNRVTWNQLGKPDWKNMRISPLPVYNYEEGIDLETLRHVFPWLVGEWDSSLVPAGIPCSAMAATMRGDYCEGREAQLALVTLLWANGTAKQLKLEWFQGPLDDCVSPEWHLHTSSIISVAQSTHSTRDYIRNAPSWSRPSFSLFVNPTCIAEAIVSKAEGTRQQKGWDYGFYYTDEDDFRAETIRVSEELENMLSMHFT